MYQKHKLTIWAIAALAIITVYAWSQTPKCSDLETWQAQALEYQCR